jgi:23S rRNA (cytidine1920-2'-O)/16S rRNA (cytidine1409-2'-O)-methyltransferase
LRLDTAVAEAGLAGSRAQAQALILAGKVRVGGETVRRPDRDVRPEERVELAPSRPYVSRGGQKLAPALDHFGVSAEGRVCADVGASTGGFTDVLLQRGAARVYALDVGRGLLHWRLRQDPRVVVTERTNARSLESFPEPVSLVTVDVSFIGLTTVLPALGKAAPASELVVLFKPQFELERRLVGKGGVVTDEGALTAALAGFRAWCGEHGFVVRGEVASQLPGPAGNREVFFHLEAML